MTEYRVCFDFTVHFTNGGSLSASDFRLDIPGSEISDDQLAAYLIHDMRLLMAGRVEIANKRVIAEPHKRKAIATHDLPDKTVDLSTETLTLDALMALAQRCAVRVIAKDGESYVLSRHVL